MAQVFFKRFLFSLFFTVQFVCSYATVKLPRLISEGMVLQRGETIKVWGWADPGEKISVRFNHKAYKTVCNAKSVWAVELPKMTSGGPFRMDIQGENLISIPNIMIGDVWVCSGQSNMELPMSRLKDKYAAVIKKASNPNIRQFNIKTAYSFHGIQPDAGSGSWVSADPVSILDFTGVGYFFAKDLYEKYHVPIGLIKVSVGGSPAEAWLSETALVAFPKALALYQKYQDDTVVDQIKKKDEETADNWNKKVRDNDLGLTATPKWFDETAKTSDWTNTEVPGFWSQMNGVVWFRKEIDLPEAVEGQAGRLLLGTIVDQDEAYVNGHFVGSTAYQYPPRKYDVPAGILRKGKNIIVVRVTGENGKGGFTLDKAYELVVGQQHINLKGTWHRKAGYVSDAKPGGQTVFQYQPAGLFNAMISPLLDYAIKGVIWYQGESNTGNSGEYETVFKTLIKDWRAQWKKKDLPFLYVQLPNFMLSKPQPAESNWAELREAQFKALELPNTGMAVAIDLGEWNDIHPLNKQEVGRRLSLVARKVAYQEAKLVYSGPLYQSMKRNGQKILLSFTSAGTGLVAKGGGELKGFSIAGKDGKFVWAKARITGKQVEVWNETLKEPVAVRYAWADNPEGANLYNKEGLPASPFRTDGATITFTNPVLSGFYPDPSVTKVGKDYYLVNSTFSYFPGIPVFHSKDLKNWKQIGNVIDRPSQMNFMGDGVSRGLFAPSINYHNGIYYVTCTLIDRKGNFVVTAKHPEGPWSDPVWLPEVQGIDPSLFFDQDKAYIVYNSDAPDRKPLYDGHRTIRLFEFDPIALKVTGEEKLLVNGGVDLSKKPVWIEGPHIFKRENWYYLCAAEGGTSVNHSQVILRSAAAKGPYQAYAQNPILTQRDLDPARANPITSAGHAELVEGPDGKTYALFLAVRPYQGDNYNTGRETFIAPVSWENGWPKINPEYAEIQYHYTAGFKEQKSNVLPQSGNFAYRTTFEKQIGPELLWLRTRDTTQYQLSKSKGLTLNLSPETCMGKGNPAFVGKRQQHLTSSATTELDFNARQENEQAGMLIFQNENHFYFIAKSLVNGKPVVQLFKGNPQTKKMDLLTEQTLTETEAKTKLLLRIEARKSLYDFKYATDPQHWKVLQSGVDGSFLSTRSAGGFVGCLFALYASSNGQATSNQASYQWLDYEGNDEVYK